MHLPHRLQNYRSWIKVIIACTIVAGVAAILVSNVMTKTYQADGRLVVGQSLSAVNPDPNQFATSEALARAYVELATSQPVLDRVAARVGNGLTGEHVGDQVVVASVRDLPFIDITATDGDPNQAAAIANAMAAELIATSPSLTGTSQDTGTFVDEDLRATEQQIQQTRQTVEDLLALPKRTALQDQALETAQARLVALRSTYATMLQFSTSSAANRITVVQAAVAPDAPSSPRPLLNTVIAMLAALLFAIAVAMVWERIDDRVKTAEDVERVAGLPTLGQVRRMPGERGRKEFYRLATLLYPRSPAAEAYRTLRTNLEFASLDRPIRTIVVTSSSPREGKTVTSSNLAVAVAQGGRKTILVDADLRRPGIDDMFSIPNDRGLSDLVRREDLGVDEVAQATQEPNLRIVTSGLVPANPAELLNSKRMTAVIEHLLEAADVVIFDTPPVGSVTDAAVLAAKADATLLVVKSYGSSESAVVRGRESLANVGARVVGAVLNSIPTNLAGAGAYYGARPDDVPPAVVQPATGPINPGATRPRPPSRKST